MKKDGDFDRYAFPTLIIRGDGVETTLPGWLPMEDYEAAVLAAGANCGAARPLPDAGTALSHYGVLAPPELEALTGSAEPPDDAIAYDWGAGEVFLSESVADRWNDAGWMP